MPGQTLPDDILHVLCEELALQEQFDTLFNCACASRGFAIPALTHLYRSHHLAPVRGGGDDDSYLIPTKQLMVQKWSILWRSIIASSLGATLFPYCRYIKTLDLRDLKYLLEDDYFRGKVTKTFFSGPMAQFHVLTAKRTTKLNYPAIIDAVGEVLSHALVRWAPRLPRLETLELYNGSPLEDEEVQTAIFEHCPHFNSLSIYTWAAEDRDHKLARFLGAVKPQSLKMLETIRDIGAGAETFLAMNAHSESLKDLRLCVSDESLPHLSLLRGCTGLEALRIEDVNGRTDIEKTQHDVFLETIDWLKNCESLRTISLTKFLSAAAIITPILLDDNIHLRRLEIDGYIPKDGQVFHQALTHQKDTLRVLSLSGDTELMVRDDLDNLVDSIKQLTGLTTLKLYLVQEIFQDEQLITMVENLSSLEDLYITGMMMKDGVLECVGNLHNLRSVVFSGISKFTTDGLLEFVSRMTPGNQGIRVMIDMADPDTILSDEELTLVRESLWEKVGGTIEYTPWRDPNISEFEGDSD